MSGFEKQTYTQIPNSLFKIMGDMDECELKVVLLICRLTFGYQRDEAKISTRKIAESIGMNTASVDKGGDAAVKRGLLEKIIDGNKTTIWRTIVSDSEFESRQKSGDSKPESQSDNAIQKVNRRDSESESLLGVKESIKETEELKKDLPLFELAWERTKEYLKGEIVGSGYNDYVSSTRAIKFSDGIMEIDSVSDPAREWLKSRIQKTAERYLVGVLNAEVSVSFVSGVNV